MARVRFSCVERAERPPLPPSFAASATKRHMKGATWFAARSKLPGDEAERFERWASLTSGRRRLAPVAVMERFQRLATSLARLDLEAPLHLLEQVRFDASRVTGADLLQFGDDLREGIRLIASIDTPAWSLTLDGRQRCELVLGPEGVRLCWWRGGGLRLCPDGVRLHDGVNEVLVARIDDGQPWTVEGDPVDVSAGAAKALERFAWRFSVEERPPETPFVDPVETVIEACRDAAGTAGIVLFHEWVDEHGG